MVNVKMVGKKKQTRISRSSLRQKDRHNKLHSKVAKYSKRKGSACFSGEMVGKAAGIFICRALPFVERARPRP